MTSESAKGTPLVDLVQSWFGNDISRCAFDRQDLGMKLGQGLSKINVAEPHRRFLLRLHEKATRFFSYLVVEK